MPLESVERSGAASGAAGGAPMSGIVFRSTDEATVVYSGKGCTSSTYTPPPSHSRATSRTCAGVADAFHWAICL